MTPLDPTLTVLLASLGAAVVSVLGALPPVLTGRVSLPMLGWSNALAAGLMLGVAYALLGPAMDEGLVAGTGGGLLGLGVVRLSRRVSDTRDLDLNRVGELGAGYGGQVILVSALHAAYEGVAIGGAMLLALPFGISMAVALALHNIPEAMILAAVLNGRGTPPGRVAALAVGVKLNQVLLAVLTFWVAGRAPWLLPWILGFAAGSLTYVVLAELLPESYREAGHTSIALVTLLAMGMVVGLAGAP